MSQRVLELEPQEMLAAYAAGIFPMADPRTGEIAYWECDTRAIVPLDERFHVPKSLARVVRSRRFDIRFDTAFERVVEGCARERPGQGGSWISPGLSRSYQALHERGYAHSVEAWREGKLMGGLFGVSLGRAFFGESMFTEPDPRARDASKVCLVHLVNRLREQGCVLLDSQYANPHMARFGLVEVPQEEYHRLLAEALGE